MLSKGVIGGGEFTGFQVGACQVRQPGDLSGLRVGSCEG